MPTGCQTASLVYLVKNALACLAWKHLCDQRACLV